jgi:hypothetical protein
MYIIAIGWLYVALMMSVAEATNTTGTVLGAIITFLLYGAGPVALLMYILGTPARRKVIRAREAQEAEMLRASTTDGQAPGGPQGPVETGRPDAPQGPAGRRD